MIRRLRLLHAARLRRWGHLGMYGLLRIYMPYAWGIAALAGLVATAFE